MCLYHCAPHSSGLDFDVSNPLCKIIGNTTLCKFCCTEDFVWFTDTECFLTYRLLKDILSALLLTGDRNFLLFSSYSFLSDGLRVYSTLPPLHNSRMFAL
jgi:hypothetical protein